MNNPPTCAACLSLLAWSMSDCCSPLACASRCIDSASWWR